MNIETIQQHTQKHLMSCAPASIGILMKQLGLTYIPDEDAIRKIGIGGTTYMGMTSRQVEYILNKLLTPYGYIYRKSYNSSFDELTLHLNRGKKALVLYMVDRNKNPHNIGKDLGDDLYGLHRAVADGYNNVNNSITLLNPFGYVEEIDYDERIQRRSLDKSYLDWKEKLLKWLHIVRPRTAFLIDG